MYVDVPAVLDVFAASQLSDEDYARVATELRHAKARLDAADRLCAAVIRNEGLQPGTVVSAAAEYLSLASIPAAA